MNNRADWIAWVLQFFAGLFVGGLCSGFFISDGRRRSIPLINLEEAPVFMIGTAFIGAALASHFGDKLWIGLSYRVIPPDAPEQNLTSRLASLVTGLIGLVLCLVALCRSFGLFS